VDGDGKSQTLPHRTRAFDLDDVEVRGFRGNTPAALHCELRIVVFRPVLFSKTLAQIDKRVGAANARRLRKKGNTAEEYRSTNESLLAECRFFPSANSLSVVKVAKVTAGLRRERRAVSSVFVTREIRLVFC
jgi:hypothetical protein